MANPLRRLLLLLLLQQQLQLVPAFDFNVTLDQVLAEDSEGDRIVSPQYWSKFRVYMDQLSDADSDSRAEMLMIPDISEFLVPAELLSAVSASLNSSSWLRQLDAEYINDGEHNMTLLIGVLEYLGNVADQREVTVPQEVLKKLLWSGLIRPEQQGTAGVWLRSVLDTFFASRQATALQRDEPTLFVEYILGVFQLDRMQAQEVLEDTLANFRLQDELAAEAGQAARAQREEPDEDLLGWEDKKEEDMGEWEADNGNEEEEEEGMGKWKADNEKEEEVEEGTAEDWTGGDFEEDEDEDENEDFGEDGYTSKLERDVGGMDMEYNWPPGAEFAEGEYTAKLERAIAGNHVEHYCLQPEDDFDTKDTK